MMHLLEDKKLIEKYLKGDEQAFGLLYSKNAPWLLGVCMRYCKNREDAEDVLQDALIRIFSGLAKLKWSGEQAFRGWMKTIAVNTALNYVRDNYRPVFVPIEDTPPTLLPGEQNPEAGELQPPEPEVLIAMVQEMPPGYRTVFNLYVFEGYGHKQISETLGISENTSKTQLLKARRFLRNKINEPRIIQVAG